MERLTKFITPVGLCMTNLNSMEHHMPCIVCRHNAQVKTDEKGKQYTEKFGFCDTCEVKMLFNRLKEYEDLEEQGLLLRLPCKVGDKLYHVIEDECHNPTVYISEHIITDVSAKSVYAADDWWTFEEMPGINAFLSKEEAEAKLKELSEGN
ncbi:hypothetical protein [Anaerostipes faecalis]|uniref:hypothetical protein n=1 Tax=Anaerostipes faecalis TaxID=2738446 RepID=UPI001C1DF822|nr:hypothetical protein [Anaerostipes faecalis]